MREVAMVGGAMIKFGRYPEKAVHELAAQAALLAMKDAGVTMKDIELLASGNLYQASATVGQRILKEIGQTGIPVINVANACATGSTAYREAYVAVASGAYDKNVHLWGVNDKAGLAVFSGHTEVVYSVAFSPDGRLLASGSYDNSIRLWDIPERRLFKLFAQTTEAVESAD